MNGVVKMTGAGVLDRLTAKSSEHEVKKKIIIKKHIYIYTHTHTQKSKLVCVPSAAFDLSLLFDQPKSKCDNKGFNLFSLQRSSVIVKTLFSSYIDGKGIWSKYPCIVKKIQGYWLF